MEIRKRLSTDAKMIMGGADGRSLKENAAEAAAPSPIAAATESNDEDNGSVHVCPGCAFTFVKKSNFQQHYFLCHLWQSRECDVCKTRFKTKDNLYHHFVAEHLAIYVQICNNLDEELTGKSSNRRKSQNAGDGQQSAERQLQQQQYLQQQSSSQRIPKDPTETGSLKQTSPQQNMQQQQLQQQPPQSEVAQTSSKNQRAKSNDDLALSPPNTSIPSTKTDADPKNRYKCMECSSTFVSKAGRIEHFISMHYLRTKHCPICDHFAEKKR